jgi:cation diffusion facilitator family transporter
MSHSAKGAIAKAAAANLLIAVFKFTGAYFTGSAAMITEGIHSIVDTGNQGLLSLGMWLSNKDPDARHPLGYGRWVYVCAVLVAFVIFGLGSVVSGIEGWQALQHPHELVRTAVYTFPPFFGPLAGETIYFQHVLMAILFGSMLTEGWSFHGAILAFVNQKGEESLWSAVKHIKDPTVLVVLFEDAAALLGLVAAFIGVTTAYATNNPLYDAYASLCIAVILALTSGFLFFKCVGLLIGQSASPSTIEKIRNIVNDMPGISGINELVAVYNGPQDLEVKISLDFKDAIGKRVITAAQIEAVVSDIDRTLKEEIPEVTKVWVEAQSLKAHLAILAEDAEEETPNEENAE